MGEHSRLIDESGNARFGVFEDPVLEINHRDFKLTDPFGRPVGRLRRHFAYNQFQYLGALSEELVFGCAIADVGYLGSAFLYFYEPATRRYAGFSFKTPLAYGTRVDAFPETGRASFEIGGNHFEMTGSTEPPERRLAVRLGGGVSVEARFSESARPAPRAQPVQPLPHPQRLQPMFICTQAGATGWVYARKTAGLGVSGSVRWEGRDYDLARIQASGHHDWSAGFMRRETFWNWGCLAGPAAGGRIIGMNVSCGVNETSFTENCFWVDGRLHKLDTVSFEYDRFDLEKSWKLASRDGRLGLEFRPEGKHVERINARVLATNFTQLFGRYYGRLRTGEGEEIRVDGILGYAERHYAKW
jgi:Domain of unknown function (DUF2804), C-terminal/Domain of unknown function (DUF2804), N-terminal